jgi:CheY-like chemotaxis protein
MAKAHSLLSQSRWEGVSIDKLLREELSPYANGDFGVALSGTDLLLTPKSALSLSLAIHELATNAAKFGSLSTPAGRVVVSWRLGQDDGITLSWRETGGPVVSPPHRRGFGSTLIERALAMETGGRATIDYLPAGVACEIFLPGSSMAEIIDPSSQTIASNSLVVAGGTTKAAPEKFRVLVVEDSFLLVLSLEAMFDDLGWEIVGPATNRTQALDLVDSETFDAALLDVNLDGEMSWDVAAALRTRNIPFVFSTGYDVAKILPDFLSGSVVISKPFGIRDVEQGLRQAIAQQS